MAVTKTATVKTDKKARSKQNQFKSIGARPTTVNNNGAGHRIDTSKPRHHYRNNARSRNNRHAKIRPSKLSSHTRGTLYTALHFSEKLPSR